MADPAGLMKAGYRRCTGRCGRNRATRFFSGPRGRVCADCRRTRSRSTSRNARILQVYNLLSTDYDRLFEAQQGLCAICEQSRTYRLAVDHCHKTGRIRGLLCKRCNNRLLTTAGDDPQLLRRAANYLEHYPCDLVLGPRYVGTAPVKEPDSGKE